MYVYIYRDTYIRIYPYRIFKCTDLSKVVLYDNVYMKR